MPVGTITRQPASWGSPETLIFFHIPKTGGTTLDSILRRCFPGSQHFDGAMPDTISALSIRSREKIEAKYNSLSNSERQAVRCLMGTIYPMGIHTMLDRPAKYVTIIRSPVERCISHFINNKRVRDQPFYERIKNMTLDEYLDSGVGIETFDYQVRLLSGRPELDAVRHPAGGRIDAPPVEQHHLELAKLNIERYFIAAAPLEEFAKLVLVLRAHYGWRLRQIMFVRHNIGQGGAAPVEPVSAAARRRLEEMNRYDFQLYDWVKARFAERTRAMEPELSRDLSRLAMLNAAVARVRPATPDFIAKNIGRLLSADIDPRKWLLRNYV